MPLPNDGIAALAQQLRRKLPLGTKPQSTLYRLDREHPFLVNAVSVIPFFEGRGDPYDHIRYEVVPSTGTPVWDRPKGNLGHRARAIGDRWTVGTHGTDLTIPTDQATVFMMRAKLDTTLRNHTSFGVDNVAGDNSTRLNALPPFSDGVVYWDFGGFTVGVNRLTWSGYRVTTDVETWVFTVGANGMAIYYQGLLRASQAGHASRTGVNGHILRLNHGLDTVNGDLQTFMLWGLLDAEWPEAWVRDWARDPWQFFKLMPAGTTRFTRQHAPRFDPPVTNVYSGRMFSPATRIPHGPAQQHPGRDAVLDLRHPVAKNLAFYTAFQEVFGRALGSTMQSSTPFIDRARQVQLLSNLAAPVIGPLSRTGPSLRFTGASNTGIYGPIVGSPTPPTALDAITEHITVACKWRAPASSIKALVTKSAGNHLRDHFDLRMDAFTGPAGGGSVNLSGNYEDGLWHTSFGTWTRGGLRQITLVDENGDLREVQAESGGTDPLTNTGERFAIGTLNASFTTSECEIEWVGVWDRELTLAERIALGINPYLFFVSPSIANRRWFLPVAAPPVPGTISPSGIASAEAFGTPILQGAIQPTTIASAEAFGVHALVDVATTISPSGIASAEAFGLGEVIDEAGAAGTLEPTGIATGEAVGTPSITETAIISPTGIPSAFDMDLHDVGVPVGTIAPFGIASEEAFSQVGTGGGINGGHTVVTPTNPPASSGTVTAKKLCAPLGLVRAELIDTALDQAVILPDVYGDFSAGGLRGPCPAVLVNSTSPFIYIAAAHPVQEITTVYVDDVEQTSGFATVTAVDLGAGFQVAVIAFSTQPTGQVSWRGKGRMNDALALIENPIEQLETILKHRNSWTTEDFDATTLAEAKAAATAAGWTTAFVFADDRQVQDWITEVLFSVMGFWRVSGRAQLQVTLDPGGSAFPQSDLVDSIVASRDCEGGDDGVTFVADRQHLVNKLEAYYLYSWSLNQPSSRLIDLDDPVSINAHGELRKSVTLRGLRDSVQVQAWAAILFERQGFAHRVEGAVVQFRVKGSRLIHATVGDLIAFTWPYGPTRELGKSYVNEILRVLTISHDYATGGIVTVTAIDTGAYVQSGGTRLLTPLAL